MHAVWTRLRHFVASVMLVAMASFALHSAAMAGLHQHGGSDCGQHASAKGHAAAHHHHDAGHSHNGKAHAHHHDTSDDGQTDAAAEPCCGSVCSVAISTAAPGATWAPVASPLARVPHAVQGTDNRPDGLKRPPRTPDIA